MTSAEFSHFTGMVNTQANTEIVSASFKTIYRQATLLIQKTVNRTLVEERSVCLPFHERFNVAYNVPAQNVNAALTPFQ